MKHNVFKIRYNNNGIQTSEFEYSKFGALHNYMHKIIDKDFNICELKIFKNRTDITEQVNKFLYK